MADMFKPLALSLFLGLAAPAFAQDAAPQAPAADAAATEEVVVGETYIAATHGDWEMQCIHSADGFDPCQLYQLLKDSDGNAVAEISLFGLPPGQPAAAGATILTPLETLLTQMVAISFEGGEPRRYPFTFCNPVGCVARAGLSSEDIEYMKTGTSAVMSLVPMVAPDQVVSVAITLPGFAAGYEAVNAANAASDAAAAAAATAAATAPSVPSDAPTPRP
ncbi:invasion associated locus B family protein [Phaeovulum sp.]|uniref:invasion associated locus B family protein n=1 Tax=Phaeovulum sp. TaxID=2934796 RepID=UPI0027314069|nr:invasion associated locus B family protein [Phaeovulum sp.]MDP1669468.1 invasion associated locus B family protein [Phaeovulum sp.]MDZ4118253.1 invasion associated locus B family protein [Phaeovulum sp.]